MTYAALSLNDGGSVHKGKHFHDGSVFILNCGFYVSTLSTSAFCEGHSTSQDTELPVLLSNLSRKSEPHHFLPPCPSGLDLALKGRGKLLSSFFVWVGYREVAFVAQQLHKSYAYLASQHTGSDHVIDNGDNSNRLNRFMLYIQGTALSIVTTV